MGYADAPGRNVDIILDSSHSVSRHSISVHSFHQDPVNSLLRILNANCLGPYSCSSSITEIPSSFQLVFKSRIPYLLLPLIYPPRCCEGPISIMQM